MFKWISSLFKPANDIIETLDISGNKKDALRNELAKIQADLSKDLVELNKAAIEAHSKIIESESKSENILQANWRPAVSVTLALCIILAAYGIGSPSPQLYDLAEIILTGHIASRGLEKVANAGGLGSIIKGKK